ncbi:MAG: GTPase domain-containing protein [Desulfobacterales bacterium]|nr:GTPase domain-containing protein [Desulfobacterales bacterium]
MAFVNTKKKEVQIKIVYFGPGRGGKTTNIEYLHQEYNSRFKAELVALKTSEERTLFFDYYPISIGKVKGYDIKLQIYTSPGQKKLDPVRKLVLRGVDGIVFVADAMAVQKKNNIFSFNNLKEGLALYGKEIYDIPFVLQYNKIDLKKDNIPLLPLEDLAKELCADRKDLEFLRKTPRVEASAIQGKNVVKTLKQVILQIIRKNKNMI